MGNVEVIYNEDATKSQSTGEPKKHKRVAAYCRVSTDHDEQASSLELQMATFRTQIELRPDWELVDIYADEGISGTNAEKRPEFQRMIHDCEEGKIDYIITKSISRFARNTLQCLTYIRQLQSWGVQLFFEKENIDTGTAFSEMLLTILAAFAQEESRSLSENAKWGIRKRFEAGIPKRTNIFGYTYDEDGNYIIVPEQADTVRRIFDLYETGQYSMDQVAQILMKEHRPSAYCDRWDASHVYDIMNNEKYVGDVLMQKKYTVDHLHRKQVKNRDHVLPSYYVRDHHVPIVSRKQYDRVHKIAQLKSSHGRAVQYPYSELLVCPVCGERLIRHKMEVQDNSPAWHCDRNDNSCEQYVLKPKILDAAVLEAYRQVDMDEVRAVAGVVALPVPKEKLELTAEVIAATSNQAKTANEENGTDGTDGTGGTDKAEPSNADSAQLKSEAPKSEAEAGARAMLAMKQKYPSFKRVDFFWLDDLVDKITFGKSRALTVYWKYGGQTTVTMQIANTKDDPIYVAGLIRQKRDKARAEEALLERASDLMASDMPREKVVETITRDAKKYADWAANVR